MQFNKTQFAKANNKQKEQVKIIETSKYLMYKKGVVYFLQRKEDLKEVEIYKDKVEDFVLWGKKEFNKESINTKF